MVKRKGLIYQLHVSSCWNIITLFFRVSEHIVKFFFNVRSHPLWCLVALALMFLTFYVSNSIAQCAACRRSAAARRTHTAARCRTCAEVRRKAACGAARRVRRLATAEATAMHFLFEAFPSSFPHYFVMDTYLVMISDEFLRIQTFKNCGISLLILLSQPLLG